MSAVIIFPNSLRICYREGIACLIDESKAKKSLFGGTYRHLRSGKRKRLIPPSSWPWSMTWKASILSLTGNLLSYRPLTYLHPQLHHYTPSWQGKKSAISSALFFLQYSFIGQQKFEITRLVICSVKRAEILARITQLNSHTQLNYCLVL